MDAVLTNEEIRLGAAPEMPILSEADKAKMQDALIPAPTATLLDILMIGYDGEELKERAAVLLDRTSAFLQDLGTLPPQAVDAELAQLIGSKKNYIAELRSGYEEVKESLVHPAPAYVFNLVRALLAERGVAVTIRRTTLDGVIDDPVVVPAVVQETVTEDITGPALSLRYLGDDLQNRRDRLQRQVGPALGGGPLLFLGVPMVLWKIATVFVGFFVAYLTVVVTKTILDNSEGDRWLRLSMTMGPEFADKYAAYKRSALRDTGFADTLGNLAWSVAAACALVLGTLVVVPALAPKVGGFVGRAIDKATNWVFSGSKGSDLEAEDDAKESTKGEGRGVVDQLVFTPQPQRQGR